MNLYKLEPIINHKNMKTEFFLSMNKAEKHLEKLLSKYNLEVEEVVYNNNNDCLEFVCDYYNKFYITKIKA
jgi:hypothetical protein